MTKKVTTTEIYEPDNKGLDGLKKKLGLRSNKDAIHYLVENAHKLRKQVKTLQTQDAELEQKLQCTYRVYLPFEGVYYCHQKGRGNFKELPSLLLCEPCRYRIEQEIYREQQRAIQKQKIHAMQLSLNERIKVIEQESKAELYLSCDPLERQTKHGYEVKSAQCPRKDLRGQYHPTYVCEMINCPFAKKVKLKKKKTAT